MIEILIVIGDGGDWNVVDRFIYFMRGVALAARMEGYLRFDMFGAASKMRCPHHYRHSENHAYPLQQRACMRRKAIKCSSQWENCNRLGLI